MKLKTFLYKAPTVCLERIGDRLSNLWIRIKLWMADAEFHEIRTSGLPFLRISSRGRLIIGSNFAMNNEAHGNPIGAFNPCTIVVEEGATLRIGDNVGISQTALICTSDITIGDNVKIGGGTRLYTSDFHSLDPDLRSDPAADRKNRAKAPITVGNNVFIGAFSIILKGVSIGDNAIIGAGSVVTKNVPPNEIWVGNPARFIRRIQC